VATWQWREADAARVRAIEAHASADRNARIALSRQLTAESGAIASRYPIVALILAIEAVRTPLEEDGIRATRAISQLHERLAETGGTSLSTSNEAITRLAFSPNARWLASGGNEGTIWIRRLTTPRNEPIVLHSPDRKNSGPRIQSKHLESVDPFFYSENPWLGFDPQERWLAGLTAHGTLWLWELETLVAQPILLGGYDYHFDSYVFDAQGRWPATKERTGTVRIWDLATQQVQMTLLPGQETNLFELTFDPQGNWIAAIVDGRVRLWELADPEATPMLLPTHEGIVTSYGFDPKGRWLAIAVKRQVQLWNLSDLTVEPIMLRSHQADVYSLTFDSAGRWLATVSEDDDYKGYLWDLERLSAEPTRLHGHEGRVANVDFSPRGRWLATSDFNNTAWLWNLADTTTSPVELRGHIGITPTVAADKGDLSLLEFQHYWASASEVPAVAKRGYQLIQSDPDATVNDIGIDKDTTQTDQLREPDLCKGTTS
jgi:WD40 repeat protein